MASPAKTPPEPSLDSRCGDTRIWRTLAALTGQRGRSMSELSYGRVTVPHDVELRSGTVTHTETFTAATPGLACKMAKLIHPGAEVLRVTRTWTPLDACIICGTIIFDGDGHRKRRGSMRCWECS